MKSKLAVFLVGMVLSMSAFAVQPVFENGHDNRGGNGGIGGGGGGSAIAGANASAGAIAGAVGVGIGGSSNVDVRNSNTNLNSNVNSNKASVNSSNVQGQIQGQAQKQGQSQSSDNSNSSNVTVNGDNWDAEDIPVSTAYSPAIQPTANCAIGISGGVQVMGFGGSFGTAYVDENCAALEKVRSVATVLQDKPTAEALMCQDVKYNKARMTAGRPCPVEQE